jgi:tRNA(His) guanylyltransferase
MNLGDRMKNYERAYDYYIPNRLPVIVRVDGKGFSRWTKKTNRVKPFDEELCQAMGFACMQTASNIEGCMFGYTQSDEMTFVLFNDQSFESTPWFGNRIQKITSVVSSMVTANFNLHVDNNWDDPTPIALFDARAFVVPNVQEAINCLIWREQDCLKNSISAACYYEVGNKVGKKTARELMYNKSQKERQEILFSVAGINWNNYSNKYKRGVATYKTTRVIGENCIRSEWVIDENLPIFSKKPEFLLGILNSNKDK